MSRNNSKCNRGECTPVTSLIVPTDFEFKIGTTVPLPPYEGVLTVGNVGTVLPNYTLGLCNCSVVFKDKECLNSVNNVLLCIPLKFVMDCKLFAISSNVVLGPQNVNNGWTYVSVGNGENDSQIVLYVADGNLYISFPTSLFTVEGNCNPKLVISNFGIPLEYQSNYFGCSIAKCLTAKWIIGELNFPVNNEG